MTDAFDRPFAFIVGAPRTGTTSLARYLRQHPSVCFSAVKEPHFFSFNDLTALSDAELREVVRSDYLDRYFPHCEADGRMLMEGSVTYLYTPEQMRAILRLWPNARFIIGVRDPMQMIPSLHQRLLSLGDETVEDFDLAWRLVDERREGRKVPRSCVEPRWLRYDEVGRLGDYVQRFISVVGGERCFVAVYDDLAADPAALYGRLLDFLELPHDQRTDFSTQRASRGYKSGFLQRLLKRPPAVTRTLLAGKEYRQRVATLQSLSEGQSRAAKAVLNLRKRLLRWNEADPPPVRVGARVRAEIRSKYLDDVRSLGNLIGRDLGHWLVERPG